MNERYIQCAHCLTFVPSDFTYWVEIIGMDGNLRRFRYCPDCTSFFKKNPPKRRNKHNWKQDGF